MFPIWALARNLPLLPTLIDDLVMGSTESDPALPLEIVDLIIQDIASERDNCTLKQCSLVCHAFCALSQRALFSSISVKAGGLSLAKTLGIAPHIAKYVLSFHIEYHSMADVALPDVLATMRNVRTLSIDACGAELTNSTLAPFQEHIFPSITSLQLQTTPYLHFSVLTCPNLDTLTLRNVVPELQSDEYKGNNDFQVDQPLPNIRALTLTLYEDDDFHHLTSLMRFLSGSTGLESLILGSVYGGTASFTNTEPFITRYKHSLQVLHAGGLLCS